MIIALDITRRATTKLAAWGSGQLGRLIAAGTLGWDKTVGRVPAIERL